VLIVVALVTGLLSWRVNSSLESIKPLTAEATLRRENYVNSKQDAYFVAIGIMSRWLAAVTTPVGKPGSTPPEATNKPSEAEVNATKAKLLLYTDDPRVIAQYDSLFADSRNVVRTFGQFVQLARNDMGYPPCSLPAKYNYIFVNR